MSAFTTVLRMVLQRGLGQWRLMLTVALGVVTAAALAAAVVIYSEAVRDLGLAHALRSRPLTDYTITVLSSNLPARRREFELRRDLTARLLNRAAGWLIRETVRTGQTATFFLTAPGQPVPEDPNRPRSFFQYVERLSEHTRLVEGRAPRPAVRPAGGPPEVEVLIGRAAAERLGVRPGQRFDLHPYWRPEVAPVRVTVVGVIEPNNPTEPFWQGRTDRFAVTTTSWPTYPFFTDEQTVVDVLAAYLPDVTVSYETYAFVDLGRINARNAARLAADLRAMDQALRQDIPYTRVDSKLVETITGWEQRLFFTRLPLFALVLQVIAIVMYYLVMIGTMLVERQAGEIALLRSRGASVWQVLAVYAVEGGALALAATLLGPFVAAAVIALLGPTPPFRSLSEGGLLSVTISAQAFALALFGSTLALAALLWPAWRAARATIVHYKQGLGRPQQQSLFLRYYLDVFLIAVAAFLFHELRQRGSLVTERLFGGLSTDPLLLAAPSLFMLMVALIFLRLFPLALRLVAWLARGTDGVVAALGLAHMVRAPLHYSRLILLLILTTAVGMFAAGFRATLNRSYEDRAAYQAGSARRVEGVRDTTGLAPDRLAVTVAEATGGTAATPVWRTTSSYTISQYRYADFTVLGVRPDAFARVAFWRTDFADHSLPELLKPLRENPPPPPSGPALPADAVYVGVWVWSPLPAGAASFSLRVVDAGGVPWDYALTGPPPEEYRPERWQFYVADLRRPGLGRTPPARQPDRSAPLRLEAIVLRPGLAPQVAERASVWLDAVTATSVPELPPDWWEVGLPQPVVVESFESLDGWELMQGQTAQPSPCTLSRSETRARDGRAAAQLTFLRQRGSFLLYGLRTRGDGGRLSLLASDTFLKQTGRKVGDELLIYVGRQYVPARIAGRFALFPTYTPNPSGSHLLVANLDRLLYETNRVAGVEPNLANEVWMGGTRGPVPDAATLRERGLLADKVVDLEALRAGQQRDPLVAASWEGILFLCFAAVLLLTALGFVVYSYLSAQTRTLEFAVLRTMGLSGGQIVALVGFEQAFVIVAGAAAGTVLGLPLGRLMLGYLGITETGAKVLPPFVSVVSWRTVAVADGLLALVFVSTIAALALLYGRLAVHRALRMGEL